MVVLSPETYVTYAEGIQKTLVCDLPSLLLGIKLVTQHLTLVVR